jgi:DNA polymerase III sliding clamp (beta) subunit (PCNA family)
MNKTEYKDGGNIIDFNPNHVPSKRNINYAKKIKDKYPKIWDLGGNIFGNEAFVNLERVSKRGYWLESEEWMYIKWRSYVARHQHDFRINGVIAMLKWADVVNKGWAYMKDLIEAKIEKQGWKTNKTTRMKQGGEVKLLAPNGKPTNLTAEQYKLVRTESFKKWFGDWENDSQNASKVIDENGEPLVVYHGTNANFYEFDLKKIWSNIAKPSFDAPNGFYFAKEKMLSSKYGKNVSEFFIGKGDLLLNNKKIVVLNNPKQIKLADGTNTTFDGEKDDIRFLEGGSVNKTYKQKFNEKYNYKPNESHSLEEVSDATGISLKGLQEIYNKGIGAFKTNPSSVRPNVKSKEQWAMARVYSAVMGGKASEVDANELKMELGGEIEQFKKQGILDLNFYPTNSEHAKEYGINAKNPLYLQNITVKESDRLKNIGQKVLFYIDEYAKNNGHDVIFGHINQKAKFSKDKRKSFFSDIEMIKNWLHNNGYSINQDNNDFHKVLTDKYHLGGDCIDYIQNSESINNNGYYLHIKNMNNYVSSNSINIPKINSLYLITFNSDNQKDLKSVDTINSMLLATEIAELLNIDIEMAKIIVFEQTTHSKPFKMDMLDGIKNENIIVADRDKIVCTNLSMKYNKGGKIDKQDSVTMDIPLLIRTLELAREDVKSDAELHHVVENLLKLKNKKVLTMDDYDYIAHVKSKHISKMEDGGNFKTNRMKQKVTEEEIMNNQAGGVLIGKARDGQTIIPEDGSMGGFLVGKLHKDGGIEAINKSNGQPIEMQGNEVVITSPAVADTTKKEFEGKMMTNREILSKINSDGGGVEFAQGGEIGSAKIKLATINKIKKLSKRILEIERLNLGDEDDIYSYKGNLTFKERAKLIKEQIKLENELTEITDNLSQTQCFSIDSQDFQDLNNAGDYGYEEDYEKGGELKGTIISNWENVPTIYKNIPKVKKVPFENNPNDKGLLNIITPFLGKDDLRPVFSAINFDKNGITVTDAHKLITLPYPNPKLNGIYEVINSKKQKKDPQLIDASYPNYEGVIRKSNDNKQKYQVSVFKLLQYVKTALNYVNKTTYQICFKNGKDDKIGFNGKFLEQTLTALLKLGHEKAYLFIDQPSIAMIFSPSSNYTLGKDEILLTMPTLVDDETNLGAEDIDDEKALTVYYDFADDSIHNADGSIAEFKVEYQNNSKVDVNYINLLSKFTNYRNNVLNILNFAKAKNGLLTATNLETTISVKNVGLENGLYSISNKALQISKKEDIEDYPIIPLYDSDESYSQKDKWFEKKLYDHDKDENSVKTAFEFEISSDIFNLYIQKLVLSKGDDDLRPVMSGLLIEKTSENEIYMVSTDAHTMFKINLTDLCKFKKDDRELKYIISTTYLKDFTNLTNGLLTIKCNKTNIFIESEDLQYIGRTVDGVYPNYNQVIPYTTKNQLTFNIADLKNLVKSTKVTELLAKYKGNNRINFSYLNKGNKFYIKANESNREEIIINELVELGNINFNFKETENYIPKSMSLFLIMPIMGNTMDGDFNFQFGKILFERMLNTISQKEVPVYYNTISSSYIISIDSKDVIFEKPKSIIKKVEVKKEVKVVSPKPKKVVETPKADADKLELDEAIETLNLLLETLPKEEHKEIKEAIEILEMLK